MALEFGFAALLSTLPGGVFALKKQDKLHLILSFSAGAVIGVAFFDLMPEAIKLATKHYSVNCVTLVIACGLLLFMLLSRLMIDLAGNDGSETGNKHQGRFGAGSLSAHSFMDGIGTGLAFQVSAAVGAVVAIAVLAHDFSDGINTITYVLKHSGDRKEAFRWLSVDAAMPFLGVLSTRFFTVPSAQLGLLLAVFCGFFLYIGAADLLPESHHRHPKMISSIMTLAGAAVIYIAIHFAGG